MPNPDPEDLRQGLDEFVAYRAGHLRGDEKGEAQVFLDRLFRAFGHAGVFEAGATLEERIARRDNGGTAFADLVWKPRVLVEMKKGGVDLSRHYRQAFEYWIDLVPDRPEFVVLCNFDEFQIYDLNRQLDEPIDSVAIEQLPRRWEALAFLLPDAEEPVFQNDLVAVTRESAARVSAVFNNVVQRGIDRSVAQRFILQALMAMFAEDIGLLPRHSFTTAVQDCTGGASPYDLLFNGLFREMNEEGRTPAGRFEGTPYFNGGLFREISAFELTADDINLLELACQEDWSQVRPAIFGTLFEQSLEMGERHAYGAHFTSETDIQKVVLPTIVRPWRERIEAAGTIEELTELENELQATRVLDPACGCGNFLYVAYREMRRLERDIVERIRGRRRAAGAEAELRMTFLSTQQFFGIDVNAFATEIAKVTLMLARKLAADELGDERAVLPLDDLDRNFIVQDALEVTDWPRYDVCIGNPPYLGRRRIVEERGASYSDWLAEAYPDIGGVSDYVCYWFRRAHDGLPQGGRAGLVATQTVRFSDSRAASLDYIVENDGVIYDAVSSQPWSGDAVVEVSIINWVKGIDPGSPKTLWLAGGTTKIPLDTIPASLSPEFDVGDAPTLAVNTRPQVCFQGQTPGVTAAFVISPEEAAGVLAAEPHYDRIIHPFMTGADLNGPGRPTRYVIDIPDDDLAAAQRWERVMPRLRLTALPQREERAAEEAERNRGALERNPNARVNRHHQNFYDRWWQLSYRRAEMITAISRLDRYIALSIVAAWDRPSIYAFVSSSIWPNAALQVFAFDDDYSFAILTSTVHRAWFEARATRMRTDTRYTPNTVFDSFPWPQAPEADAVDAVATAAAAIIDHREELLETGITLGQAYNSLREPGRNRLRSLHEELDRRVIQLYGFEPDEDLLTQIYALNQSVAAEEAGGLTQPRGPGNRGIEGTRRTNSMIG